MKRLRHSLLLVAAVVGVFLPLSAKALETQQAPAMALLQGVDCENAPPYCPVGRTTSLAQLLKDFPMPAVTGPSSPITTPVITVRKPVVRTVTYVVTTRGAVTSDLAMFKAQAAETLNHANGWSRLGVKFSEVASGGDFTLVLSEASQVPSFGSPCDTHYSCNVGRYVIINQDRWETATTPWNQVGGDIRNYRHMVVNHEAGHWLGHGHRNQGCTKADQPAPLMQQQSIDLRGCKFNPWPLDSEIHSSRLGI